MAASCCSRTGNGHHYQRAPASGDNWHRLQPSACGTAHSGWHSVWKRHIQPALEGCSFLSLRASLNNHNQKPDWLVGGMATRAHVLWGLKCGVRTESVKDWLYLWVQGPTLASQFRTWTSQEYQSDFQKEIKVKYFLFTKSRFLKD